MVSNLFLFMYDCGEVGEIVRPPSFRDRPRAGVACSSQRKLSAVESVRVVKNGLDYCGSYKSDRKHVVC